MRLDPKTLAVAQRELAAGDLLLAEIINRVGPCKLKKSGGGYEVLVRSILSQQISTVAARTVHARLVDALPGRRIAAEHINQLDDDQLQAAGISRQKRAYLRDLTEKTLDGTLNFRRLARANDEDAIGSLIAVKGIGRWTAQMFLMFCMLRPDVFAPDDLGLQNATLKLYGGKRRMGPAELSEYSKRWMPWRTVAAWYLWRSLDS